MPGGAEQGTSHSTASFQVSQIEYIDPESPPVPRINHTRTRPPLAPTALPRVALVGIRMRQSNDFLEDVPQEAGCVARSPRVASLADTKEQERDAERYMIRRRAPWRGTQTAILASIKSTSLKGEI